MFIPDVVDTVDSPEKPDRPDMRLLDGWIMPMEHICESSYCHTPGSKLMSSLRTWLPRNIADNHSLH